MKEVNLRKTTERAVMNERIMVDKILVSRKLFLKLCIVSVKKDTGSESRIAIRLLARSRNLCAIFIELDVQHLNSPLI